MVANCQKNSGVLQRHLHFYDTLSTCDLRHVAKSQGIWYRTPWHWCNLGKLPVTTLQHAAGTIRLPMAVVLLRSIPAFWSLRPAGWRPGLRSTGIRAQGCHRNRLRSTPPPLTGGGTADGYFRHDRHRGAPGPPHAPWLGVHRCRPGGTKPYTGPVGPDVGFKDGLVQELTFLCQVLWRRPRRWRPPA